MNYGIIKYHGVDILFIMNSAWLKGEKSTIVTTTSFPCQGFSPIASVELQQYNLAANMVLPPPQLISSSSSSIGM